MSMWSWPYSLEITDEKREKLFEVLGRAFSDAYDAGYSRTRPPMTAEKIMAKVDEVVQIVKGDS